MYQAQLIVIPKITKYELFVREKKSYFINKWPVNKYN